MANPEPQTKEEYETRYAANFKTEGYGIENTRNRFPCPFCAAKDWHVVRIIDFGGPHEHGTHESDPIKCEECGRSAKYIIQRGRSGVTMEIVQVDGPDAPEWIPIRRDEKESE